MHSPEELWLISIVLAIVWPFAAFFIALKLIADD